MQGLSQIGFFERNAYTKATKNQGHHLSDLDFFVRGRHIVFFREDHGEGQGKRAAVDKSRAAADQSRAAANQSHAAVDKSHTATNRKLLIVPNFFVPIW